MSDIYQFKIENLNNSKGMYFYQGDNVNDSVSSLALKFPIPLQESSNNVILNLGGFSRTLSLNFILKERGTSVSTNVSDSVITLKQQWEYLMDDIIQGGNQEQVEYRITIYFYSNGSGTTMTYNGMIEDISISPPNGGQTLDGSLSLTIGTNYWT